MRLGSERIVYDTPARQPTEGDFWPIALLFWLLTWCAVILITLATYLLAREPIFRLLAWFGIVVFVAALCGVQMPMGMFSVIALSMFALGAFRLGARLAFQLLVMLRTEVPRVVGGIFSDVKDIFGRWS